uniref:Uncharacterized protein n=1 Tax=Megaselia scalaris TaxID=36166 RepID=T1GNE3_MEGSC
MPNCAEKFSMSDWNKGYRTFIDLRASDTKDQYCQRPTGVYQENFEIVLIETNEVHCKIQEVLRTSI